MGWNISHGTDANGEFRRSYTSMANLAQHLAHVLPRRDWRSISDLFDPHGPDSFSLPPREADRVAHVLNKAAESPRMPDAWAQATRELAAAAARAANSKEYWRWS